MKMLKYTVMASSLLITTFAINGMDDIKGFDLNNNLKMKNKCTENVKVSLFREPSTMYTVNLNPGETKKISIPKSINYRLFVKTKNPDSPRHTSIDMSEKTQFNTYTINEGPKRKLLVNYSNEYSNETYYNSEKTDAGFQ